jgi:hypothetical protein
MKISQHFSPEMIKNFATWVQQLPAEEQQEFAAAQERLRQLRKEQIDRGDLEMNSATSTQIWKNQETFINAHENIDPVFFSYFQRWKVENNITDTIFTTKSEDL